MTARARRVRFVLEEVVAVFRAREGSEDAIVVIGDEPAMRVLAAWRNVDQSWTKPDGAPPEAIEGKLGRLWGWIVSGWDLDARRIARLAGMPTARVHEKLEILVGNRLIYPDGSMSKAARAALLGFTAKQLGIKRGMPKAEGERPEKTKPKTDDVN